MKEILIRRLSSSTDLSESDRELLGQDDEDRFSCDDDDMPQVNRCEEPRNFTLDKKMRAAIYAAKLETIQTLPLVTVQAVIEETGDRLDEVEKGVKDKFQWRWLEEKEDNEDFFSTYIRKINQPAYKLKDGLSEVLHKGLVKKLREVPFSMNIDECTAKNNQKILSILVSYFCEEEKATVVYPLASVSLKVVSAEVVYQAVCEVFEKENIPYGNLISVLSDSAAYMRGKTSGFETLLRKRKAPHLLDIDGDVCHHIHNSVKQFCSHFENTVEQLCDDLNNDIKRSADVKSWLQELCGIYSCVFHTPNERIPHRWLSVLDVSSDILNMLPAILCMYFSYVPNNLKHLYKELMQVKDYSY
ncbi:hypothetical protein HOLleu_44630 [Holothuria leucospilota]|uniref:DUF4371 domain-containing protein n=1 Tax=Holothuria leucospilota TaxID=206669 RepID=A0A9Q0Y8P4_HOLLE|nr:hypothetical protein HOLleu_44630 [Holothuria leucospilota]